MSRERPYFVATGTVAVAPAHMNAAKHAAGEGGSYAISHPEELRASRELRILRPRDLRQMRNRTRCGSIHAERRVGSLLSPECRGDGDRRTIRKGGRPRKYETENDRRQSERRQNAERQKAFRVRVQRNGKLSRSFAETKDLQAQKTHLSHYPLTPASSAPETCFRKGGSTSD
jgi:hypothetical protein